MKIRDIMTTRPLSVRPGEAPQELERLMRAAQVHHMPLIEDGRLVGLWLATEEGPLVLLGPETVHETTPEADAGAAVGELLGGREAVLVWEDDAPVGVLTRADVLRVMRLALAQGVGRRWPHRVVLRLVGEAGAGKTTLLVRTVALLRHCEAAVVQANDDPVARPPAEGVTTIRAPEAHWRKGLRDVVERLEGAQLVIVEDRDGPAELGPGLGDDLQVVVVPAGREGELGSATLVEAQAVVITKLDQAPEGFRLDEARERLRGPNPALRVFGVAAAVDDRGLEEWKDWIERNVLPRQH